MKIAFKNFLMTLRRYKAASLLNIVGLTLAFTAFYIIASQVWYSMTYNRAIEHADRIYMLSPLWNSRDADNTSWSTNCPLPVSLEGFELSPDTEIGGELRLYPITERVWVRRNDYNFEKFGFNIHQAHPDIIDLFSFRTVAGDLKGFEAPQTLVISRSSAEKLQVGIGDPLFLEGGKWFDNGKPEQSYTVVGIFEDFPRNTLLHRMDMFLCNDRKGMDNNSWSDTVFVRLKAGSDPQDFADLWQSRYASWYLGRFTDHEKGSEVLPLRLTALDKMYYCDALFGSKIEQGTVGTTATLIVIAATILLIAFINFVNFFLALIPVRIRAVNICKVFGAARSTLRSSFLFEAIGLVSVAMMLALYLMIALQETPVASFVTSSLRLADNLPVIALMGAILLVMAVAAALWPAFYITRFNASMAVKAGFAGSHAGRRLRSLLIGVQFTASMILFATATLFFLQYRHMIRADVGFDRENILMFEAYDLRSRCDAVLEQLEQYPDAAGVTASCHSILGQGMMTMGYEYKDKYFTMQVWDVRYNLPEVLGFHLTDGALFTPQSPKRNEVLVSDNLHEDIGVCVGEDFAGYNVCGVLRHVRLTPVSDPTVYSVLACTHSNKFYTFYLRLCRGADIEAACDYIRRLVARLAPEIDEPSIDLLDTKVAQLYETTKRQTVIITLFALLAVVISLMGVFGIVLFETQYRRSEIAIRKILGASTTSIIGMFNRRYVLIVAVCFVVATPVSWLLAERWLSQFAYRIDMPYWLFVAAGIVVLLLTASVVTLRSWSAANENPSRVMKTN